MVLNEKKPKIVFPYTILDAKGHLLYRPLMPRELKKFEFLVAKRC